MYRNAIRCLRVTADVSQAFTSGPTGLTHVLAKRRSTVPLPVVSWAGTSCRARCSGFGFSDMVPVLPLDAARHMWGQLRTKITIPENRITTRVSRSSGPGGQSVNKANSRVQLSFNLNDADWLPEDVCKEMRVLHKNRISKNGELTVACQITSSQIDNHRLAMSQIQKLIEEAEKSLADQEWHENKLEFTEWVVEKKKKEGREKELEKREEGIKDMKRRNREKTKNKKIQMY